MMRAWYAAQVCEQIARGNPQDGPRLGWGWRDYLARWIWLKAHALEADPPRGPT